MPDTARRDRTRLPPVDRRQAAAALADPVDLADPVGVAGPVGVADPAGVADPVGVADRADPADLVGDPADLVGDPADLVGDPAPGDLLPQLPQRRPRQRIAVGLRLSAGWGATRD